MEWCRDWNYPLELTKNKLKIIEIMHEKIIYKNDKKTNRKNGWKMIEKIMEKMVEKMIIFYLYDYHHFQQKMKTWKDVSQCDFLYCQKNK